MRRPRDVLLPWPPSRTRALPTMALGLGSVTPRGACGPIYKFCVKISNEIVTHLNLVSLEVTPPRRVRSVLRRPSRTNMPRAREDCRALPAEGLQVWNEPTKYRLPGSAHRW